MFKSKEVPLIIGDNKLTLVLDVEFEKIDDSFSHEFGNRTISSYQVKSLTYEIKETNNWNEFNIDADYIEDVVNEELDAIIEEIEYQDEEEFSSYDTYEEMYG